MKEIANKFGMTLDEFNDGFNDFMSDKKTLNTGISFMDSLMSNGIPVKNL